jgi:glycosyltransferase involved in cell wall biosynthesis
MSLSTVSVIMPTYNGAALVAETIDSVLAQTLADWELVIVDDCSTDDTLQVLARYDDPRIVVIASETNEGPVHARNRALAATRGRYIAGLDQDDLCRADRFATQAAWLDAHPDTALVASAANLLENGRVGPWPGDRSLAPATIDWLMLTQNPLVWSSVMFRADAARRLDPFERPEVRYAEDFDFYQRIRRFGVIARLDEPLLVYRCHPGGASKKYRDAMAASAGSVLARAYAPIFGDDASKNATLVVKYLMARDPVPDLATLGHLSKILATLHAWFLKSRPLEADTRTRIDREHGYLWWLIVRPALRRGTVKLRDALDVLPEGLRLPANDADRLVSPLIGRVRSIGRGWGIVR